MSVNIVRIKKYVYFARAKNGSIKKKLWKNVFCKKNFLYGIYFIDMLDENSHQQRVASALDITTIYVMKPLQLHEVMQTIQTYFDRQFSGKQFRCQAEVMQIKQHKTRVYIDLVEYDGSGVITAKMKAIVWEVDLLVLYLHAHWLTRMDELIGKVICFEASCGFHAQWWLSLHVQALSHEFARGQLHLQQEKIRTYLRDLEIYDQNKQQQLWLPPLRLAVISSQTSEGLRDFITILEQSPRNVEVELFAASIHGESAKQDVVNQLYRITDQWSTFSAVVITRGGWWGEGLAWQNDQAIAKAICRLPIPVLLATGHTSDRSILDEIVWHAAKTPSDAAHLLLEGLEHMHVRLNTIDVQIEQQISARLLWYTERIEYWYAQINANSDYIRARVTQQIDSWRSAIQLVSPKQQWDRGYALVTDEQKEMLSKAKLERLVWGDTLRIYLYEYEIEVEVKQIHVQDIP